MMDAVQQNEISAMAQIKEDEIDAANGLVEYEGSLCSNVYIVIVCSIVCVGSVICM